MAIDKLYITEKRSVAKELAAFLEKATGKCAADHGSHFRVGEDAIVPMRGHLLRKVDAPAYDAKYAKWSLDYLPIVPNPFRLEVVEDKDGFAKKTVALIAKLLRECNQVVGCGDPDAEGQLIQDELLDHLRNQKPVMRIWTSGLDEKSLRSAFSSAKPNSAYQGYGHAAKCRSEADWLLGINATIAFTLSARELGFQGRANIGRVQTPTLGLVVARELSIRSFKKTTFFTPTITARTPTPLTAKWRPREDSAGKVIDTRLDVHGYLSDSAVARSIVESARRAGTAYVVKVERTAGTEAPPLMFSLTALQNHCSKKFGLTAKQTLDIAQRLYISKLLSYPRSDSKHLLEEQFDAAQSVLQSHLSGPLPDDLRSVISKCRFALKSKTWDSSKCIPHYAISPVHVDDPALLAGLSGIDLQVYLEVVRRFALQFWPAAKFTKVQATLRCGLADEEETYRVTGKSYIDPGWKAVLPDAMAVSSEGDPADGGEGDVVAQIPELQEGQTLQLSDFALVEGATQAPQRYTDGSLAQEMEDVYRHVKNPEYRRRLQAKGGAGIGTSATRGPMIETMVERGFLIREKKTGHLCPSEESIVLITSLPEVLRAPDMTAMWQLLTDEVRDGRMSHEAFIGKIVPWVSQLMTTARTTFKPGQFGTPPGQPGQTCFGEIGRPGCGSALRLVAGAKGKYQSFFSCTNRDCGKTFNLNEQTGKAVERQPLRTVEPQNGPTVTCPKCNEGQLRRTPRRDGGFFWGCSNFKNGCKAGFNDADGKPELAPKLDTTYACPRCGNGYLQKRTRKAPHTGAFWGCSAWKEGCTHIVDDKEGKPDLHGPKSFTRTGKPRIEQPRFSRPEAGAHPGHSGN